MRCGRAELLINRQHFSREDQVRRAAVVRRNFHILPTDSASPARLQCFQSCFFCGKARGIMLGGHHAATVAVFALGAREYPLGKTRRAQQHFANSRNFDNVYTDGNDHE